MFTGNPTYPFLFRIKKFSITCLHSFFLLEQVASLYNSKATIQLQYHKHKISTTASLATPCQLVINIQVFNVLYVNSFKLLSTPTQVFV